ncbi:MAG: hypothetical protein WAV18_15495 [Roseiarcus sp.]
MELDGEVKVIDCAFFWAEFVEDFAFDADPETAAEFDTFVFLLVFILVLFWFEFEFEPASEAEPEIAPEPDVDDAVCANPGLTQNANAATLNAVLTVQAVCILTICVPLR